MSQQSVLCHWTEEVRKNMPRPSKPQSKVLWMVSLGVAALGSDKMVKEAAGGRARAARGALFKLGLTVFHLCLEMGRDISCALLFSPVPERGAKMSCSKPFI